jgi:hypothetical protein
MGIGLSTVGMLALPSSNNLFSKNFSNEDKEDSASFIVAN